MEAQQRLPRLPAPAQAAIDRRVQREMLYRLDYYARHPDEIDQRLDELEAEWDAERTLQANAAGLGLLGLLLGPLRLRYRLLPLAAFGFLLQHALRGWCAPMGLLRRLGYRTRQEIAIERQALKILRGDFDDARRESEPEQAAAVASR